MKKNRSVLKDYFKKGAIPSESNFADLIDSMLNQEEDCIDKLTDGPLSVTAVGVDETLINFYRLEENQKKLGWQLRQKTDGKCGLSIGDETDNRLFIESGTGKVGIGTNEPRQTLDVRGRLNVESGVIQRGGDPITSTSDLGLYSRVDKNWIRIVSTNGSICFFNDGGIGTNMSLSIEKGKVEAIGVANIHDGNGYAVKNNYMASGSLTIGSINQNYGGGSGWSANTAGLMLETQKNTEIAVHDSNHRLVSLMFYEGDADNHLTIGRDMGWGTTGLSLGNSDLYFTKTDHNHTGFGNNEGYAAIENAKDYDALMILGRTKFENGKFSKRVVKLWDYLEVNGELSVAGSLFERLEVIKCGGRGDWGAQNHPIMQYFKNKLSGRPVGTMIRAIQDHPDWRGHYWQGWVDADGRIRVIHNYYNTTNVAA